MSILSQLPDSVLQCLAIFLSIIIEALPFVLLGTILSGLIEVFVTPEQVFAVLPKHKGLRIVFGTLVGFIFPSCECGIVPIVNRFLQKQVPSYTAIPFMTTAPMINPIVLFATYSAFGNSFRFVGLRLLGAILIASALGIMLAFVVDDQIVKEVPHQQEHHHDYSRLSVGQKVFQAFSHAIDDFFDTGRYLVFGSLVAACMQIYIPTRVLTNITHNPILAILVMMLLAFILSLCSEADAFIGSSLLANFGIVPVLAFLLLGPLLDIKNLLMMQRAFKARFIWQFMATVVLMIFAYCLLLGVLL